MVVRRRALDGGAGSRGAAQRQGSWANYVRTPLGLVDEGGGVFTLFYTGFQKAANSKDMASNQLAL